MHQSLLRKFSYVSWIPVAQRRVVYDLCKQMQKINLQLGKDPSKQINALKDLLQKQLPEVIALSNSMEDVGTPEAEATEEQKIERL